MWIRPADAAAGYDRGELLMMPPTIATLRAAAAVRHAPPTPWRPPPDRDLTPVLAQARLEGGELVLSWPGHDEFTKHIPTAPRGSRRMTDAAALPGQPRGGGPVAAPPPPRAVNVLAPNPSRDDAGRHQHLDRRPSRTPTWPSSSTPARSTRRTCAHVVATAERAGKRVALTLLTHGHPDHAEGAARFAELTGTPVRALDPALRLGDEGLAAGDVITTGGLELRVVPTPGHTADSLCFHLPGRPRPC